MRLLDVDTFKLESFPDANKVPAYAILSHRWENDEVLFEDLQDDPLQALVKDLQKRLGDLENRREALGVG